MNSSNKKLTTFLKEVPSRAARKPEACAPPEISAKGGDAPCNSASNSVGGAGHRQGDNLSTGAGDGDETNGGGESWKR